MSVSLSPSVSACKGDEEEEDDACNFVVMSDAGKPIYYSRGREEEISRLCGLVLALRSSAQSSLGQSIRSISTGGTRPKSIVFMSMGSLVLLAISSNSTNNRRIPAKGGISPSNKGMCMHGSANKATEWFLQLQLEYILGFILSAVTERIQEQFNLDPSYDLREAILPTMNTNDTEEASCSLTTTITTGLFHDDFDGNDTNCPGPYCLGAVETLFPISPNIRSRASTVLQTVGLQTDFTAFAILAVGQKLLTLIQPSAPQYQLHVFDLHVLLRIVSARQGQVSDNKEEKELWIPLCLPFFSSTDYLFCYAECLDSTSNLALILLSNQGNARQLQLFQTAAGDIRKALGIPPSSAASSQQQQQQQQQHKMQPGTTTEDYWNDQDYVDVSLGDHQQQQPLADRMLPVPNEGNFFVPEIQMTIRQSETLQIEHYLGIASVFHFLFRLEVPIGSFQKSNNRDGEAPNNSQKLAQCLSPPLNKFPFVDARSRRRVWRMYQTLRWRLLNRESNQPRSNNGMVTTGMERHCPAVALAASSVITTGTTLPCYIVDGSELFLAMNGSGYEFYAVLPSTTSIREAEASATKLLRRLVADQKSLFLTKPMCWDD
ncbi:fusion protein MON1 homolog A [Seminavis robusta]|uniref:Fusion protein MON1 homolog A n=1 Tax=Seminavis robusta TaxID=568900 RepID=A0A9N8HDV4_9STRA|nr:fusion protein MON1 homolog A [Seminavis robusta]|eukprot:Sro378_g130160.1 fusion protein MON1 homolog A (603) ;mRNA; f:1180-3062